MKALARLLLKMAGWKVNITVPDYHKCIICVAPHTSNWDFIIGKLAYASVGRRAGFLMKDSWFVWPLGYFFRAIGGIPVSRRNKKRSLTDLIIEKFDASQELTIAITPEGTRSRTTEWHTGFLRIARDAHVRIVLGAIDYSTKQVVIEKTFRPSDDFEADMRVIKEYYRPFKGKYPDKFATE
ncbi:MAG: 1-acyl-sn-glycerol-3-phosphate acyltransferase [Muribaculaceae bacterium]|nr:1-acyl-sn-glycerol-3-phosphate acyltransferase [Muribaculaceae bacterium]